LARKSPAASRSERKPLQEVASHIEKGGLHKSLGIPMGEKIPAGDLAVKSGDSTKVKKEKNLAKTFAKYRKGGKK